MDRARAAEIEVGVYELRMVNERQEDNDLFYRSPTVIRRYALIEVEKVWERRGFSGRVSRRIMLWTSISSPGQPSRGDPYPIIRATPSQWSLLRQISTGNIGKN